MWSKDFFGICVCSNEYTFPTFLRCKDFHDMWVEHLERMENGRFPRDALYYLPKGRRDPGRPRKRWSRNRQPPKP
jgi:hypothetical protein